MIFLIMWLAGAVLGLVSAIAFQSNGWAVIGLILMAPAMARGVTHDLIIYFPRKR